MSWKPGTLRQSAIDEVTARSLDEVETAPSPEARQKLPQEIRGCLPGGREIMLEDWIEDLIKAYKRWRLRRAREQHAKWKARRIALGVHLQTSTSYSGNPYNRNCFTSAAANEAKYAERVTCLENEGI